jgi:hypothetical protein
VEVSNKTHALVDKVKGEALKDFNKEVETGPKVRITVPGNEEERKKAAEKRVPTLDRAIAAFDAAMQKEMDKMAKEITDLADKKEKAEKARLLEDLKDLEDARAKRHQPKKEPAKDKSGQSRSEFGGLDLAAVSGLTLPVSETDGPGEGRVTVGKEPLAALGRKKVAAVG